MRNQPSKLKVLLVGVLGIVFGFFLLYKYTVGQNFPAREILIKHSGSIQELKQDKSGIEFILSGNTRVFYYSSINGNFEWTYKGLESALNREVVVTVLHESNGWTSPLTNESIYHIYTELWGTNL